jgi:GMP synthase-like glutamine amidotransferase
VGFLTLFHTTTPIAKRFTMNNIRLAILDLYDGIPNQGMRCIREIAAAFGPRVAYEVFDVRGKGQVPDLDFDVYISSGGPGDPRKSGASWEDAYYRWLDRVRAWNQTEPDKKPVLFICHSFQMAVEHFALAEVCPRRSMSFGTYPIHLTETGQDDPLFADLPTPFWAADFRRYQVIQPDDDRLARFGAEILAMEKIRPHVDLERAVMAIRFSPEMVGVQFHPEADPEGMRGHFRTPEIKAEVIEEHGEEKWAQMMLDLADVDKLHLTHDTVIPGFLRRVLERQPAGVLV